MNSPKLRQLDRKQLRHLVARNVECKQRLRTGGEQVVFPPYDVIDDMLAYRYMPVPPLTGVVNAPFFTPSGRLVMEGGYDAETCRYLSLPESLQGLNVPTQPKNADVEQSVEILQDVVADFPFASDADRANALAKMLDPFTRTIHDKLTPLYVVEAAAPGTGKGLLVDVLTLVATGEPALRTLLPANDIELGRKLFSFILVGADHIHFDNFAGVLDSEALASLLTSGRYTDRKLCHSETQDFYPRMNLSLSGNNVVIGGDLGRRVVLIRLDANMEHPETRTRFKHPKIERFVMECRGTIVTACLTLIQSWLNGGAKYGSGILGGYEEWAGVASGILEHAGIAGFNENRRLIQTRSDAQAIANEAMVQLWWEQHGNSPVRASDLLAAVGQLEFPPVTVGETDRATTSSLGRWLRRDMTRSWGWGGGRKVRRRSCWWCR